MTCQICQKDHPSSAMRKVVYTDGSSKLVCNDDYYREYERADRAGTFDHAEPVNS